MLEKPSPDSADNLSIERGRYCRPPIPSKLQIYPSCPLKIQDEYHFLFECSEHKEPWTNLITQISMSKLPVSIKR